MKSEVNISVEMNDTEEMNTNDVEVMDTNDVQKMVTTDEDMTESENEIESDTSYVCTRSRNYLPELFSQDELSDLGRELGLSKEAHELLASRLKEKNLLEKGVKITLYRNRESEIRPYFTEDKSLDFVYCNDIPTLLNTIKPDVYKPDEWRLFILF